MKKIKIVFTRSFGPFFADNNAIKNKNKKKNSELIRNYKVPFRAPPATCVLTGPLFPCVIRRENRHGAFLPLSPSPPSHPPTAPSVTGAERNIIIYTQHYVYIYIYTHVLYTQGLLSLYTVYGWRCDAREKN